MAEPAMQRPNTTLQKQAIGSGHILLPRIMMQQNDFEHTTPDSDSVWDLRLYVAGQTERSGRAMQNLHRLGELLRSDRYCFRVVDLIKDPELAWQDQVVVLPSLVKHSPRPQLKVAGDLSSLDRVVQQLGLAPILKKG